MVKTVWALALAIFAVCLPPADASAAARKPVASCEASAALKLVGAQAPGDKEIRLLTGAKTVRRVAPGQSVTLDYRPERVTLEIASGQVVATSCG
ncbi:hypothetical protein IHQ68_18570 [Chelatococcus sambhunathii]|uniref:Peptidase inhibitor I78 family n=2 Tax=Chelatococcus sambhunathii TaxID=363953 RepID=A0ABU1DKY6_9HYPH|nr:hypothetical protein [Chelatococcus sambhunathii]